MSKIDNLLLNMQKKDTKFLPLLDVVGVLYGYPCDASFFNSDKRGFPLVRIRDIPEGVSNTYTTESIPRKYIVKKDDLLVGMDGNFHVGLWKSAEAILCQRVCKIYSLDEKIVLNKYLRHLLPPIINKIEENKQSGTVKHLLAKDIKEIKIPIPTLEDQCEIVRILDNFAELTAELTAELSLRKSQAEFYIKFLTNINIDTENTLDKNFKILRGKRLTTRDMDENGKYPVFHGGIKPIGYYSSYNREAGKPMIINVGASAGTVGYSEEKFWSSDGCYTLSDSDAYLNKFIYYYLSTKQNYLISKVRRAGIPTLDVLPINSLPLPKLSIEKQQKIINSLDNLNTICFDIKEGLPAEIKLRQQQYEYYRDKLLSFKDIDGYN